MRPGGGRATEGGGRLGGVEGGERGGEAEDGRFFSKEQIVEEDEGRLRATPTGRVQNNPLFV